MKIPKLIPGEEFTDLDLLSKLLQPKRTAPKSKIEVLGSEENLERSEDSEEDEEDQEEAIQNWEIEQSIVNEERDLVQSKSNSLGTSCQPHPNAQKNRLFQTRHMDSVMNVAIYFKN